MLAARLLLRVAALAFVPSLAAVPALAQEAAETEREFAEVAGEFVVLRFHGGDEGLAKRALPVLDSVWRLAAADFGVAKEKPKQPLQVNLYRTIAGYEAAEKALTGGKFRRNLAMFHHRSRTSHVALQPPCGDETLRALGLPEQTLVLLAWETAHLARAELSATFADHPDWLVDGFASSIAKRATAGSLPGAADERPIWSHHWVLVRRLRADGKLPPVESLLTDAVGDLDFHDRYATRVTFYSFLEHGSRAKLAKLLAGLRSMGGGPSAAERIRKQGLDAFRSLDEAFAKHVDAARPVWEQTYRSLAPIEGGWAQVAYPDTNAIAWRLEPQPSGSLAAKGSLRILPGGSEQLNFLLGRTDEGFVSIAFSAAHGIVVFDYRSAADEWNRVGSARMPALRLGIATSFEVRARGRELVVALDGESRTFELPRELPERIVWGLGAQAGDGVEHGSAGLWLDLVVK